MKTFVTGATGLLGNNLVRALRAEGHSVRALVRSKEKAQRQLEGTGTELVVGDMENVPGFASALGGVDAVFHTAAYFREYYGAGDHWPKLEAINVLTVRQAIDRLEGALASARPASLRQEGSGVRFRGGVFRFVPNWNPKA